MGRSKQAEGFFWERVKSDEVSTLSSPPQTTNNSKPSSNEIQTTLPLVKQNTCITGRIPAERLCERYLAQTRDLVLKSTMSINHIIVI